MTDQIGEDGFVRLRVYDRNTTYLDVMCRSCQRWSTLIFGRAIRMTSPETTIGQLSSRLRCEGCGGRGALLQIAVDTRPENLRQREGLLPQVRDQGS
jgi:ribosomal protein S27E